MAKLNLYAANNGGTPILAPNVGDATSKAQVFTTAEDIAIPSDANVCRLKANQDFWYELEPSSGNVTATVPSADETSGSSIYVMAGQEEWITVTNFQGGNISVVSDSNTTASALFWQ